jgi:hypothetical protein
MKLTFPEPEQFTKLFSGHQGIGAWAPGLRDWVGLKDFFA